MRDRDSLPDGSGDLGIAVCQAALDDRLAIVGRSGYGKTNAGKVLAEKLLEAGARVCIIDPTDAWWGLRLQPNGKAPGFPVAIFGGAHGDLALTESAGDTIGRAIAESSQSTIVSMADFIGENARRRFASAFLSALYTYNREPLHLIVDEADTLAPQRPLAPLDAEVLARMQQIVRRGRIRGFVPWLITQRPAVLNKDVLSQADTLIAFNLTASQDRDAIGAWIEGQADKAEHKAILADLPKLDKGTAVVWAPGRGILARQAFPLSATFDSGRTPKRGEKRPTAELKTIDVAGLRASIVEVEETAKANDPASLRTEIARLKDELGKRPAGAATAPAEQLDAAYRRGRTDGDRVASERLRQAATAARLADRRLGNLAAVVEEARNDIRAVVVALESFTPAPPPGPTRARQPVTPDPASEPTVSTSPAPKVSIGLSRPQQRILDALAWLEWVGSTGVDRVRVAMLADQSPKSSGFRANLSTLSGAGLLAYRGGKGVELTEAGRQASNKPAGAPTDAELHRVIKAKISGPQWRMLGALMSVYPRSLLREDLARLSDQSVTSSGFRANLSTLSGLGFLKYESAGNVAATPILFVER